MRIFAATVQIPGAQVAKLYIFCRYAFLSGARIVKHWRRKTGFSANGSIYKRVNRVEIPAIFKEIMLWRII
jgi:hypothetical protein